MTLESGPKTSGTFREKYVPINKFNYKETPLLTTFLDKTVERGEEEEERHEKLLVLIYFLN